MGWEHACMHYCSDGDKDEDGTLDADAFAVFASCAMCHLAYTINTCVYWPSKQGRSGGESQQLFNLVV